MAEDGTVFYVNRVSISEIRVAIYTALLEPRVELRRKRSSCLSVSKKQRPTATETVTSGYYRWSQGKILGSTFKIRCKDKLILQYLVCLKRFHKGGIEWMVEGLRRFGRNKGIFI